MQIYNWGGGESATEYIGETDEAERAISWFDRLLGDPLPSLEEWDPPSLIQYRGANGKRKLRIVTDCVYSAELGLVSERAVDALSDIWDRHAKLYPVVLDDAELAYYMVVVTTQLDCLDRKNSSGSLQKYGPTPDRFASVHTWQFNADCVGDSDLFVIPDSRTNMFVSARFRERVTEAALSGFTLKTHFWQDDPWES